MRDLVRDLEICNKATPGPWRCLDDTPVDPEWANIFPQDLDFVMESREGWPHALERAIEAEAAVERYKLMVKSITGGLDEAIETVHYLEAENALLRKVEEVGEIMWGDAICHRCESQVCRGCSAHDFKKALSEYQSWKEWQELDKEGAE